MPAFSVTSEAMATVAISAPPVLASRRLQSAHVGASTPSFVVRRDSCRALAGFSARADGEAQNLRARRYQTLPPGPETVGGRLDVKTGGDRCEPCGMPSGPSIPAAGDAMTGLRPRAQTGVLISASLVSLQPHQRPLQQAQVTAKGHDILAIRARRHWRIPQLIWST